MLPHETSPTKDLYRQWRRVFLAVFVISSAVLLLVGSDVFWGPGDVTPTPGTPTPTRDLSVVTPEPGTPGPVIPEPETEGGGGNASLLTIISLLASVTSLLGVVSTTILGWRKERRDSQAAELERQRQALEIEKLRRELGQDPGDGEDDGGRRTQSDDLAGS